ncbi:hypothetical protein Belba_0589 [Belliella baltica DSM 15883]|uniref:Uncharacterized protein n=1 Tax=Belliella baltica (strain DSM 15883 / CIP 108006 / LMG 21964 / BA134) TaxID=866536 RepID=I3Z1X8_BELBD|nr:hypothetical protein [Belliella baltica]AFL83246.1 hypothetical protein Belba_0589 [Belliella baltica DSM 15883]
MNRYVVNNEAQANGDHEVHKSGCAFFPSSYQDLGNHSSCRSAIVEAKKIYSKSDGCFHCSSDCHTR